MYPQITQMARIPQGASPDEIGEPRYGPLAVRSLRNLRIS